MRGRVGVALVVGGVALGLLAGCGDDDDGPSPTPSGPTAEAAPAPGTLLSSENLAPHPILRSLGATVQKITYASRSGVDDRPIEVTGVVITPRGTPPAGGWPTIAYAHGTTGLADVCAPSSRSDLFGGVFVVAPLVAAGHLVTATDYEGLGTPDPHPYLQPTSEARGVIDSVAAARELVPAASPRWVALGGSQGGQAVWATAQEARDENFLGAAALAPPTDIAAIADQVPEDLSEAGRALYPAVLTSVRLAHPEFDPADLLSGTALDALPDIERVCDTATFRTAPTGDYVPRRPEALEQVRGWLREWALPTAPARAPLFVAAGGRDTLVPQRTVDAGVRRACDLGWTVDYRVYPDAGHPALPAAALDTLRWIEDRFAGRPAPDTC